MLTAKNNRSSNTKKNFILVTTDPERLDGTRGEAFDLIKFRCEECKWPIYERTRNRQLMDEGSRVAFYVAGVKKFSKHIIGWATIIGVSKNRRMTIVDPEEYLTDSPHIILELSPTKYVEPIDFESKLWSLEIAPKNKKKWGVILMGGSRSISELDWNQIFG